MSYPIENKPASKAGWHTPAEARSYYGHYSRDAVTVHWWNSPTTVQDSDHDAIVNYILGKSSRGVGSIHYVVSNNKISKLVEPDNVAWHAQKGNPTTIGIEFSSHLNAEGYKKAGWIINELDKRYGKTLQLVPHKQWYATACPGNLDLNRMRQEANKWKSGAYAPAGDEMITSNDQAIKIYKMLRPNSNPSAAEITSTAGKRSYEQFVNDAQREVAQRDEIYRNKDAQYATVSRELDEARKQINELVKRPTPQAFQDLQNTLEACRVKAAEAAKPVVIETAQPAKPEPPKLSLFAQVLLWFANRKKA